LDGRGKEVRGRGVRPYLICSHDYRRTSAGVRALHKLCHLLNEAGLEAWVDSAVVNPEWKERVAGEAEIRELARDGVVVYPEVEDGNKYQARRVVRYLLNIPGRIRKATFTEGEMMFRYCDLLWRWCPGVGRRLFIPVVDQEVFKPWWWQGGRDGGLVWVGKGNEVERVPETAGCKEITLEWPGSWEELAAEYGRAEVLYSYQPYGAMVIEARLCGCPVVVMPNKYWSYEGFRAGTPGGMSGLGWGVKGLSWARSTVRDFPGDYERYLRGCEHDVEGFVKATQEWGE
jgi:hypothetical protein